MERTNFKERNNIELISYYQKSSPSFFDRPENGDSNSQRIYHLRTPSKEVKRLRKYRAFQKSIYMFLEKPSSWTSIIYHSCVFLLILASLVLSIVTTIEKFQGNMTVDKAVFILEILLIAIFSVEYLLRLWSCASHGSYSGCSGKLKFIRKPYMVIDIIVISATLVLVIQTRRADLLNVSVLRFLRFLQVLRILRLDRQRGAFKMVSEVIYNHRQELMTCWYMSFIILITCSFLVYLAEKSSPASNDGKMIDLADGLYWGIISLLTIGYGDISPQTWVAKFLTCFFSLIGTAFFALPAGILGSGFALQVAQHQREKHFSNRRIPAAILIQNCWRKYATDPVTQLHATWIRYLQMTEKRKNVGKTPSSSPAISTETRGMSIIKKLQLVRTSSIADKFRNRSNDSESREEENQLSVKLDQLQKHRAVSDGDLTYIDQLPTDDEVQSTVTSLPSIVFVKEPKKGIRKNLDLSSFRKELSSVERVAIRFILHAQFAVSVKKFKEARRPYDVKDVIEQYTAGQMEMFGYIKKFQSRVETALGIDDDTVGESSKANVIKRLGTVERKVEIINRKLDLVIKMLSDGSKDRSNRTSSFRSTHLSPDARSYGEKKDEKPPSSLEVPHLDKKKKRSRFRVTIVDSKDSQNDDLCSSDFS